MGLQLVPTAALQPAQVAHQNPLLSWQNEACGNWQHTEEVTVHRSRQSSRPSNAPFQQAPIPGTCLEITMPSVRSTRSDLRLLQIYKTAGCSCSPSASPSIASSKHWSMVCLCFTKLLILQETTGILFMVVMGYQKTVAWLPLIVHDLSQFLGFSSSLWIGCTALHFYVLQIDSMCCQHLKPWPSSCAISFWVLHFPSSHYT